jgi:hypothetical protein
MTREEAFKAMIDGKKTRKGMTIDQFTMPC